MKTQKFLASQRNEKMTKILVKRHLEKEGRTAGRQAWMVVVKGALA